MSEFKTLIVKNTTGDVVCPSDKAGTFALNENLKTINNQSIIGTGNIDVSGAAGIVNAIKVNGKTFTPSDGLIDIGNVLRNTSGQTINADSKDYPGLVILDDDSDISELYSNKLNFYGYGDGDSDYIGTIGYAREVDDSGYINYRLYVDESYRERIYFTDIANVMGRLHSSKVQTGVSQISTSYQIVYTTVTANAALSFFPIPESGYETHVIIKNNGSSTISITLPNSGSYVCTSESTIYIAAGKCGEVNVVGINGTGYVHGISSI